MDNIRGGLYIQTNPSVINFDAKDEKIEDILFSPNKIYKIPRYQRPYAWDRDQVEDFWSDLHGNSTYNFLGSLVFNYETVNEDGYIDVIDGQQRLLTITIFTAVLRDIAKELGDEKLSERIQRKCIADEDMSGKYKYRIKCGDSTQQYFNEYIQKDTANILDSKPKKAPEKKIKNNYIYFNDKVLDLLRKRNDKGYKIDTLLKLVRKISDIKSISIKIQNEEDAYEIFETFNARGIELSVSDLLKNLVFKKIKKPKSGELDIAKLKWSEIEDNIIDTNTELKKFFRYYWLSKYSFVSEKKLFKSIKNQIVDYEDFLEDIVDASQWFNKMVEGNLEDWREIKHGPKIYKSLEAIKNMKVTQCYVLFLSILRNLQNLGTDPAKIFRLVEKFTLNYSAICKLPANKVEKLYSKYAIDIEEIVNNTLQKKIPGHIQSVFARLENELSNLRPSWEEFNVKFSDLSYGKTEKSRRLVTYVLSEINKIYETGETTIDFTNVNIEHILPKTPSKEWKVKKSEIKSYVDKIGNLTLVHKTFNAMAGNRSIEEKVSALNNSDIPITKMIVDQLKSEKTWGEKEIFDRHDKLAQLSYSKVWNF